MKTSFGTAHLSMVYFALLFLLYSWVAIQYTWQLEIWSPLDEIAHYDYIVKLSTGHLPMPAEPIEDISADLIINHNFNWIPSRNFAGTKETMGLAGLSYEAHQPPFYYILMQAPYLALNALVDDPAARIRLLREIGVLAQIIAAVLIGVCIHKARRITPIHPVWAVILPVMAIIPGWDWRAPLGNGGIALLVVTLACVFLLDHINNPKDSRAAALSVLFGVLAFLTKYSYLLILALVCAVLLWIWFLNGRKTGQYPWRRMALALSPLLLVPLYLGLNLYRFGPDDVLGTKFMAINFAKEIEVLYWGFAFFRQLLMSAFTVPYWPVPSWFYLLFLAGCAATALAALRELLRKDFRSAAFYGACLGITGVVIGGSWIMTKVSSYVDWVFFRHFSAVFGFWLVAMLGFAFRPGVLQKVSTGLLAVGLLVPLFEYFF